ncbi:MULTISPECIES: hypothetical protein [Oerskovia]|uniref:Uncharacterized protein n=2 Tax=Oerskovia TaxID=162491 RepID=A0ABX2YCY2_9CELL|nr:MULTISPECIES: hypothetical protein [Oerskovia]MBD7982815.1 hypothetical protein [Oerskovia merdavium]OCI32831.1 hypothetical protein OERS_04230 [Oerskovia enterophila]
MAGIENATRTQVVIAALTAAGPQREDETGPQWEARQAALAAKFAAVIGNDRHPVVKAVEQVAGENTKIFTASVVSIVKEESSKRGLVTLHTGTERSDDGTETVRTERTDNPIGLAMAKQIRTLVGHDVVVWVEVETMANGNKARVLRHVEDRGETKAAA